MRALVVGNSRVFESKVISCLEADPEIEVVGITSQGREAVRLAEQFEPHLVITEFDMPDMTGPDLTRVLNTDRIPPPAVIVVSSTDDPYKGQLAHRAGADGFVASTMWGQLEPLVRRLKAQSPATDPYAQW